MALSSSAAEALSFSLQSQYCSLVTLTLLDCRLLSNASKQLAIGIGRNTSLHKIDFCSCQLASADFKVLADALRDNKTLKEVNVNQQTNRDMIINHTEIQALAQCNQCITFDVRLYYIFVTFSESID